MDSSKAPLKPVVVLTLVCITMPSAAELILALYATFYVYCIGIFYVLLEFYEDKFRNRCQTPLNEQRAFRKLVTAMTSNTAVCPVAVVTGGSGAIGGEIVRLLLDVGFRVISISRESGSLSSTKHERLTTFCIDMTDLCAIKRLGDEIVRQNRIVHLVICNAGIMLYPFKLTKQGFEPHMCLHVLSHAVLVDSLVPALRITKGRSRIVFVSSSTGRAGHIDANIVKKAELFTYYINGYQAYATSKLATTLYAEQLNRAFEESYVADSSDHVGLVCSLHPGCVPSTLYRNTAAPVRFLINSVLVFWMRTAHKAATEVVFTALRSDLEGGAYYELSKCSRLQHTVSSSVKRIFFDRVQQVVREISSSVLVSARDSSSQW